MPRATTVIPNLDFLGSFNEPTPVERIRTIDYRLVSSMTIARDGSQYVVEVVGQNAAGIATGTYRLRLQSYEVLDAFGRMSPETHHTLDDGEPRRCAYSHGAREWFVTSDAPSTPPAPAEAPAAPPLSTEVIEALPQEVKDKLAALATKVRTEARLRRSAERRAESLTRQITEEQHRTGLARTAKDTALRAQGEAEQKVARLEARNTLLKDMLGSTNMIRTTAVIWRDATKGSAAKLRAFKNFCTALDSLPAEQDLDADFPLAG